MLRAALSSTRAHATPRACPARARIAAFRCAASTLGADADAATSAASAPPSAHPPSPAFAPADAEGEDAQVAEHDEHATTVMHDEHATAPLPDEDAPTTAYDAPTPVAPRRTSAQVDWGIPPVEPIVEEDEAAEKARLDAAYRRRKTAWKRKQGVRALLLLLTRALKPRRTGRELSRPHGHPRPRRCVLPHAPLLPPD
jgi:hypothetical protein